MVLKGSARGLRQARAGPRDEILAALEPEIRAGYPSSLRMKSFGHVKVFICVVATRTGPVIPVVETSGPGARAAAGVWRPSKHCHLLALGRKGETQVCLEGLAELQS